MHPHGKHIAPVIPSAALRIADDGVTEAYAPSAANTLLAMTISISPYSRVLYHISGLLVSMATALQLAAHGA